MVTDVDVFEDRPLPDGVDMTDWSGTAWKELSPERVQYLTTHKSANKAKIVTFLSTIPVGEGRKREGLPDLKSANKLRNALYRSAKKAWGIKPSIGAKKSSSGIRVEVTHDEESDTYQVEFVHLPPQDENEKGPKYNKPETWTRKQKGWKEKQREEIAKDELHKLCLKHETPTVTASRLYNALKHGEINTPEDLEKTSLDEIAAMRFVGEKMLAIIAEMKKGD